MVGKHFSSKNFLLEGLQISLIALQNFVSYEMIKTWNSIKIGKQIIFLELAITPVCIKFVSFSQLYKFVQKCDISKMTLRKPSSLPDQKNRCIFSKKDVHN